MSTENNEFTSYQEEGLEGSVTIMENAGEMVEGVLIGKGRNIGEGQMEKETLAIKDSENGELLLVPITTVLASQLKLFKEASKRKKSEKAFHVVRVIYKGKKTGKHNTYHDFSLLSRLAAPSDMNVLSESEEKAGFDASNI